MSGTASRRSFRRDWKDDDLTEVCEALGHLTEVGAGQVAGENREVPSIPRTCYGREPCVSVTCVPRSAASCPSSQPHIPSHCLGLRLCCCQVASVMSHSVRPQRCKPTRLPRPWDSPGKNTGVGCHFLLQCMKVKSESEVAQSCLTPSDHMDCSPPGSSVHGFSRQEYWSGVPSPSPGPEVQEASKEECSRVWPTTQSRLGWVGPVCSAL